MTISWSLSNRIFLATALMAILSIGLAILVVNGAVTRQAEAELRRGLEDSRPSSSSIATCCSSSSRGKPA